MKNLASIALSLFIPALLFAEEPTKDARCEAPKVSCEEPSSGLAKFIAPVEIDYVSEALSPQYKEKVEGGKPLSFFFETSNSSSLTVFKNPETRHGLQRRVLDRARDYDGREGFINQNQYPLSKPRLGDFLDSIDYVMIEKVREDGLLSSSIYKLVEMASALNDIDVVLEWKLERNNNEINNRKESPDKWSLTNPRLKITGSGARLQIIGVSNKNFEYIVELFAETGL